MVLTPALEEGCASKELSPGLEHTVDTALRLLWPLVHGVKYAKQEITIYLPPSTQPNELVSLAHSCLDSGWLPTLTNTVAQFSLDNRMIKLLHDGVISFERDLIIFQGQQQYSLTLVPDQKCLPEAHNQNYLPKPL